MFSIQSHRWYTFWKIWSHTCAFYFWCIEEKCIHMKVFGTIVFRWFMRNLIFPKPSSSLTGSSPKCRNCITNVNLSLVIIDLRSWFYTINPKTNKTCMLAWQQVPDFCNSFIFLLKGWEEFMTFWAYAFDLVTSPFKGWSIANELEKNNRLSSAGTSIFIPSFWLNSNTL